MLVAQGQHLGVPRGYWELGHGPPQGRDSWTALRGGGRGESPQRLQSLLRCLWGREASLTACAGGLALPSAGHLQGFTGRRGREGETSHPLNAQSLHLQDQVLYRPPADLWLRELNKLVMEHSRRVQPVAVARLRAASPAGPLVGRGLGHPVHPTGEDTTDNGPQREGREAHLNVDIPVTLS